jgi:hypothetical protein
MTSILKVDTIQDQSGNNIINENAGTITIGASGDTISIPSGVTFDTASATVSYPAGSITDAAIASSAAIATTKLGVGAVLQVVSATYAVQTDSSSNVGADTGLTASITPSSASNKILVIVDQNGCGKQTNDTAVILNVFRDATGIGTIGSVIAYTGSAATNSIGTIGGSILDSPNTTSSVTYKTQFLSWQNNASVFVQFQGSVSTIILIEIKG